MQREARLTVNWDSIMPAWSYITGTFHHPFFSVNQQLFIKTVQCNS